MHSDILASATEEYLDTLFQTGIYRKFQENS